MSGTVNGGRLAAQTNKSKYGADFHQRIGAIGGAKGKADGVLKGFATMDPAKVRAAGIKGGTISRRGPVVVNLPPAFVLDTAEFSEGFDQPRWRDRLFNKLGRK